MRAAKVDANQSEIVSALRAIGCTVQHLHSVGKGCPDLLVGYRGVNMLMEIKDGNKPPSARLLTADQIDWHGNWRGQVVTVSSAIEALSMVDRVIKEQA